MHILFGLYKSHQPQRSKDPVIGTLKVDAQPSIFTVELHLNLSAVHHVTFKDKTSQILHHSPTLTEDILRLGQAWRDENHLSENNFTYRAKFNNRFTAFRLMWDGDPSCISTPKHRIELTDDNRHPVFFGSYSVRSKSKEFEKVGINRTVAHKVIEPTQAKWAVPIVFAEEKKEKLLFYIDYRKVMAATRRDLNSTAQMNKIIDFLDEAAIVSISYTNSRNRQVEIFEVDRSKTSFSFHHELYHSILTLFGYTSLSAPFIAQWTSISA